MSKAEMVAEVSNSLIAELIERSKRSDGIRDYFDIAVMGYSGDGIEYLLPEGKPLCSIKELATTSVEEYTIENEYTTHSGSKRLFSDIVRRWIKAKAKGSTPMYEALFVARDIIERWCAEPVNDDSFPPIIFNITDGESSDCNYDDICDITRSIKKISTSDGDSLVINIHISSDSTIEPILFPSLEEIQQRPYISRSALSLYHSSSDMPELFHTLICEAKGINSRSTFKGVGYNSSAVELITILNIGSISVRRD